MADDLRVLRVGKTYTIVASQTSTATNTGTTAVRPPFILNGVFFLLDVTAQATEVDDTLDVQVQTSLGGTWVDVVAFTQVLGHVTPPKYPSPKVEAAGVLGAAIRRRPPRPQATFARPRRGRFDQGAADSAATRGLGYGQVVHLNRPMMARLEQEHLVAR